MRIQNKKTIASILFVLISFVCVAQIGGDIPPPPPPSPPTPPGAPIDGGVLVLLLLGLIYGITKIILNLRQSKS